MSESRIHDWVRQHLGVGWIVYTCLRCGQQVFDPKDARSCDA